MAPNDNGAQIIEYIVELVEPQDDKRSVIYLGPKTLISLEDMEFQRNKTYYFVVRARNFVGISERSEISEALELPSIPPDQPLPPTLIQEGSTLWIKWLPPSDNGCEITNYVISVYVENPKVISWLSCADWFPGSGFSFPCENDQS